MIFMKEKNFKTESISKDSNWFVLNFGIYSINDNSEN